MGKTMTREQRKNSKYTQWDEERKRKNESFYNTSEPVPKRDKPRKKWRPHSEIEAD